MCQRGLFQLFSLNKFSHLYEAPRLELLMDDGAGSRYTNVEAFTQNYQLDNILFLSSIPLRLCQSPPLKFGRYIETLS